MIWLCGSIGAHIRGASPNRPAGLVTRNHRRNHLWRRGLAVREFVVALAGALVPRKALWLGEVRVYVALVFPERLAATPTMLEFGLIGPDRAPALRAKPVLAAPRDQTLAIADPAQAQRIGLVPAFHGAPCRVLGHQVGPSASSAVMERHGSPSAAR